MREFRCTVYGIAQPSGSKQAGVTKTGRRFCRDANPAASAWKRHVAMAAGAAIQGQALFDGPVFLVLTFYRSRPKGHFNGKGALRATAPPFPTAAPDTTKLVRGAEDALKGIAFRDDAQVVDLHARKLYGEPVRVEIVVMDAERGEAG